MIDILTEMNSAPTSTSLTTLSTLATTYGSRLRDVIHTLKDSSLPHEILALQNEVSDLRTVLDEISTNRQTTSRSTVITGQTEHNDTRILYLLRRAYSMLTELDEVTSSLAKLNQHNELVFQKRIWLRKRNFSKVLVQELRKVKQDIGLVLLSRTR